MFAQLWPHGKAEKPVIRLVGLASAALSISWLTGCVVPPAADSGSPEPSDVEQSLPPEMVSGLVSDRVLTQAAADLQRPLSDLSIRRFNQATWRDGCLGLGRPEEGCLLALVPGWQLEVVHDDQSDFYRTDATGEAIRRSTLNNNLPPAIAAKVVDAASSASDMPASQLTVTAAEPRLWDGCLGVAPPETACTDIAIYGWQAVVAGDGVSLVYHTDMTGNDIRLNNLE